MGYLILEVLATLRLLVKKFAVEARHVSSRWRWTSLASRLQSSRDGASLSTNELSQLSIVAVGVT